jgi:ribokinase
VSPGAAPIASGRLADSRPVRVAVVGHVEWIEFARVPRMPAAGDIVHASEVWEEPGGGGAVAAVQLSKLVGAADFYTALGGDDLGARSRATLTELGLAVEATTRPEPQRRGFVHVDGQGERTITVIGDRLGPLGADPLPWERLGQADAVYLTAGDAAAVRAARAADTLVSTARGLEALAQAGVELDALVTSANDRGECYRHGDLDPAPRLIVRTAGARGGTWEASDGTRGGWEATGLPGPVSDAYGCGDSSAAGLTYGLGAGYTVDEALTIAARCGAACLTGRGPYAGQLTAVDL